MSVAVEAWAQALTDDRLAADLREVAENRRRRTKEQVDSLLAEAANRLANRPAGVPSQGTPTAFTDRESLLLFQAMGRMPYAAGLRGTSSHDRPLNMDDLMAFIAALSERLTSAGETAQRERTELYQLKADVAALRRLFGTDAGKE